MIALELSLTSYAFYYCKNKNLKLLNCNLNHYEMKEQKYGDLVVGTMCVCGRVHMCVCVCAGTHVHVCVHVYV